MEKNSGLAFAYKRGRVYLVSPLSQRGESLSLVVPIDENESLSNPARGTLSILIAERNPIARTSLSELFSDDGHHVHEAADSSSGILHLKNNSAINVIMLDVEIPAWQSVVAYARDKLSAPIIILGMGILDVLDAQQLGLQEYLLKPLAFDDVRETISRLVDGSASARKQPGLKGQI
jgi:DNA-binding NtrC family response regulator